MPLHAFETQAGHTTIKDSPNAYYNLAVIALDNGGYAISITGRTGRPRIVERGNAHLVDAWQDLNEGPHIPQALGHGTGFWKGKSGFSSATEAMKIAQTLFEDN